MAEVGHASAKFGRSWPGLANFRSALAKADQDLVRRDLVEVFQIVWIQIWPNFRPTRPIWDRIFPEQLFDDLGCGVPARCGALANIGGRSARGCVRCGRRRGRSPGCCERARLGLAAPPELAVCARDGMLVKIDISGWRNWGREQTGWGRITQELDFRASTVQLWLDTIKFGPNFAGDRQHLATVVSGQKLAEIGPNAAHVAQNLAGLGPVRIDFGLISTVAPNSARFSLPTLAKLGSTSTKFGARCTEFGPKSSQSGRLGPTSSRFRSTLSGIEPKIVEFG